MITADDLQHLRSASSDYTETEALKAEFRKRRVERIPFFLTGDDLDRIFRWKLRDQYGRRAELRARNTDATYRVVTEAVFSVVDPEFAYESAVRLGLLVALPGVGVPVASAILALTEPHRHCVIDFRGWRAVFGERRVTFTIPDYVRYHAEIARLAGALAWPVQETDLAVWEYDRRRNARST